MLDPAMPGEVEDRLLAEPGGIKIARHDQHLVALGRRLRDDLAIGIDDQGAADQMMTVLDTGLGHSDHPA